MYSYRIARALHTPIDWGEFCKRALVDANQAYRRQLLQQATDEDLGSMYRALMKRRQESEAERDSIEEQLRDIDREVTLRKAT